VLRLEALSDKPAGNERIFVRQAGDRLQTSGYRKRRRSKTGTGADLRSYTFVPGEGEPHPVADIEANATIPIESEDAQRTAIQEIPS